MSVPAVPAAARRPWSWGSIPAAFGRLSQAPPPLTVLLGVGLLYALLATSAYELFGALDIGVTFFPPAGLTFAAFLVLPHRSWPAIALGIVGGEVAVNLSQGQGVWWSLGWAAANLAEPVVGASVARRLADRLAVSRRFAWGFLVGGLLAGPAVGATVGAAVLGASSQMRWIDSFPDVMVGDGLGVLVVAPIVLVLVRPDLADDLPRRGRDAAVVAGVTAASAGLIVAAENLPLGYAAIPLLALPAARYSARELSLAGLVIASVLTAATARGRGPWASLTPEGAHAELVQQQAFLLVALGGAWMLKLEVLDRLAAVTAAQSARARLRAADQLARDQRNLSAMHEALSALAAAETTAEVLRVVEEHSRTVLDAVGTVVALEDQSGRLHVISVWGTFERPFHIAEVLDPDADIPIVVAARTNRPVLGGPDGRKVAMPLSATGTRGAIGLFRSEDAPWSESSQIGALAFASIVGDALSRTQRYEAERSVALTLQHAIMPGPVQGVDGVRIAGRYLPATEALDVGGDWYDVVVDSHDGSVVLVIGDVEGHSLPAAASMGTLAAGARALAVAGHPPADLLVRLDDMQSQRGDRSMATMACGRLDVAKGRLRYALAGHPPPLLRGPNGTVTFLEASSPPLGVGIRCVRPEAEVAIEPGSLLLLYTDGLVERRRSSIDERLEQLASLLESAADEPGVACDGILDQMLHQGRHEDDVAVLCVAVDAPPSA